VEEAAKQVGDEKIKGKKSKGRDALPPIKTSAGGNTQFILLKNIQENTISIYIVYHVLDV
jgi:hypothetical protein